MLNQLKGTIGVLGGCGVFASIEFLLRLEKAIIANGFSNEKDQPEVITYNVNRAPDRIEFANGIGQSFVQYFVKAGLLLKNAGADFICMPCNTAHVSFEQIQSVVGLPFVNLIQETVNVVSQKYKGNKKIGILCSSGTKRVKLFDSYFDKVNSSLQIFYPKELNQQLINQGINQVKLGKCFSHSEYVFSLFSKAMDDLVEQNVDCIVLGCTEIPLSVSCKSYKQIPIIDTLDVLVESCVRQFLL